MAPSFLSLPGEIRNRIYYFALTTNEPIVDPSTGHDKDAPVIYSPHHAIPALGTGLLRANKLIHAEAPVAYLYTHNTFRFTSVTHIHKFMKLLPPYLSALVRDVEINVRDVNVRHPDINRDWAQYLSWSAGVWAQKLGSLRYDAPSLKVLRLNFESWPKIEVTRRHLWDILRRLLGNVEGMERIVLTGSYAKGTAMERREPWDPVYFVGTDEVVTDDVVDKMWATVAGNAPSDKIIRWERDQGRVALEVVSRTHLSRAKRADLQLVSRQKATDAWPRSGACSVDEYFQRKDPLWFACTSRRINPTAFV